MLSLQQVREEAKVHRRRWREEWEGGCLEWKERGRRKWEGGRVEWMGDLPRRGEMSKVVENLKDPSIQTVSASVWEPGGREGEGGERQGWESPKFPHSRDESAPGPQGRRVSMGQPEPEPIQLCYKHLIASMVSHTTIMPHDWLTLAQNNTVRGCHEFGVYFLSQYTYCNLSK